MASSVTIDKAYFETLIGSARQYANLRRNLFRGGITEDTLALLVKDDASVNEDASMTAQSTVDDSNTVHSSIKPRDSVSNCGGFAKSKAVHHAAPRAVMPQERQAVKTYPVRPITSVYSRVEQRVPKGPVDEACEDDASPGPSSESPVGESTYSIDRHTSGIDRHANRTVQLYHVPEGVTLADVVEVVRGGQILDVYLRTQDRGVNISFVEESAAQDFFRHVKRNDLYLRGKRVDIRWSDRQFVMPGHVARNITNFGATRNLVLENRNKQHTEEMIRADLEHIHNLVVIKVTTTPTSLYIFTNSVHNAMNARTCMMSRLVYRGAKITWYPDECAVPYETFEHGRRGAVVKPTRITASLPSETINRFQLLDLDSSDGATEVGIS